MTPFLPNEKELAQSEKIEDFMEEESTPKYENLPPSPMELDLVGQQPSSSFCTSGTQLVLEDKFHRYFEGFDSINFNYPKNNKNIKQLENKDFNFWSEGVDLLDKCLHDQVEFVEKEISFCNNMTFKK